MRNYKKLKETYPDIERFIEVKEYLKRSELLTGENISDAISVLESKLSTLTMTETCENADVVICMDTTGSMASHIKEAKNTCEKLVKEITARTNIKNVKFSFVAYRDHPPEDTTYITKVQPLTDQENILAFIATIDANGGGDTAEAVLDGIHDSIHKVGWRTYS